MIDISKTYKIDLSKLPAECAASNMPRICNGDVVRVFGEDIFPYTYFQKLGIKCYVVKVIINGCARRSKDKGAISKIPETILIPHIIDLSIDKNRIMPSNMYKTKGL